MYRIAIYDSESDQLITIYNSASQGEKTSILSGELELGENKAGSLSLTIPPGNVGYGLIKQYITTVIVFRSDNNSESEEWIWSGRCIDSKEIDMDRNMSIECEGALAFLNDTHQLSEVYENYTINQFLVKILQRHNTNVDVNRRISLGVVTVSDGIKNRYLEYEGTLEAINDIIKDNGGHLVIRSTDGLSFALDYVVDYNAVSNQYINFGKNLLDYTANYSLKNFATVILPLGKEDEETHERLTVKSVNDGSIYVTDDDAVAEYGWIEKMYDSTEIDSPSVLLSYAQGLLTKSLNAIEAEYNINAIDLHNLDNNISRIKLYDTVRVISSPHNLDTVVPVVELTYDLTDPSNDEFTLGTVVNESLSSRSNNDISSLNDKIRRLADEIEDPEHLLELAQQNAARLITEYTTGYVTIRNNAIYISNDEDYSESTKLWMWTMGGFGYSNDGGNTVRVAMTMDGAFVADFITTGTMSANRIRTGSIISQTGNTSWNLDTGEFSMLKGSINLGSGNFVVDSTGSATVKKGIWEYVDPNSTAFLNINANQIKGGYTGGSNPETNEIDMAVRFNNYTALYFEAPYTYWEGANRKVLTSTLLHSGNEYELAFQGIPLNTFRVPKYGTNGYYDILVVNGLICGVVDSTDSNCPDFTSYTPGTAMLGYTQGAQYTYWNNRGAFSSQLATKYIHDNNIWFMP